MRFLISLLTVALWLAPQLVWAQTVDTSHCPPTAAHCDPLDDGAHRASFGPGLGLLAELAERGDFDSPAFGRHGAPAHLTEESVGVTLRFARELSDAEIAQLEASGVAFLRRGGELSHIGPIYEARVEWDAFDDLADYPTLERVEAEWYPTLAEPLEVTSETVGAAPAHVLPEMAVDGDGVTVADIDSGFDVLHPHFFRADGGYYEWRDENENGEFDAGVDTIEVDGEEAPLRVLDGTSLDRRHSELENDDEELQAQLDWVYADVNGDSRRNAGAAEGFDESDPAYGEPLFVVDDVDKDDVLEPGEKLVRLETSKFRKVVARDGKAYERGVDLIYAVEAQDDLTHGTGVMSTVGGGQKGFHRRVGLAPGVEMVGYMSSYDRPSGNEQPEFTGPTSALADLDDEGAALVLHEWTDIVMQPPDGSTNLEMAMDTARDKGIVQVNPVGNLNQADKHIERQAEAGRAVELDFVVGQGLQYGQRVYPYSAVHMSIFWRGEHQPSITLQAPDGAMQQVALDGSSRQFGSAQMYGDYQRTSRGTHHAFIVVWRERSDQSLAQGTWRVSLEGFQTDDNVVARVSDPYTSWNRGIAWRAPTRDWGTIVYPSSADSAFGVGAFAGRHANADSQPGELRGYSGRGPRLDGQPVLDITAPDDPFAALGVNENYVQAGMGRSWFRTFGGTSGAAPHVAAAIALLKEQHPDWTPDQIEQRLRETADADDLSPDHGDYPNAHWGYGKVDAFSALYDDATAPEDNAIPQAQLTVEVGDEVVFDASDSADADDDPLEYRFDADYDGEWDTDWSDEPTRALDTDAFEEGQEYYARVEVRDVNGARSGALDTFEGPRPIVASSASDSEDGVDDGCGCSAGQGPQPGGVLLVLIVIAVVGRGRLVRSPSALR